MITVKPSIRSEEVRLQGEHVLFVEGEGQNPLDPQVLNGLFDDRLRIEPLGGSFSIKSVAKSLHPHHPRYYFLIDRDHHDDEFVQKCWENFPNPETYNLLVWKQREIENYFLDPDYLFNSQYCKVKKEKLEQSVLTFSKKQLFLDAANYVVIGIREELKKTGINKFSNPYDFPNKKTTLEKLKATLEFGSYASKASKMGSVDEIENRFNECLDRMTGGASEISFEDGAWLSMIQGKKVLHQVVHSKCFQVLDNNGTLLSGKNKLNAVIKDLLKKDKDILPADFRELKQLIHTRLNGEGGK